MKSLFIKNFYIPLQGIIFYFKHFQMKGTVKWFDTAKGYGFITTEAGGDIFVHYTGINKQGFAASKRDRTSNSK